MSTHIKKLRNTTFFCLYDIRRMRKYLDKKSLLTLVHAFITSRLDYCNSLLYGLPNTAIFKLQRVQNAAARLVTFSYKFSHVTPALCNFSKVSICLWAAILGRCWHLSETDLFLLLLHIVECLAHLVNEIKTVQHFNSLLKTNLFKQAFDS